jgi:hypothetical protein
VPFWEALAGAFRHGRGVLGRTATALVWLFGLLGVGMWQVAGGSRGTIVVLAWMGVGSFFVWLVVLCGFGKWRQRLLVLEGQEFSDLERDAPVEVREPPAVLLEPRGRDVSAGVPQEDEK